MPQKYCIKYLIIALLVSFPSQILTKFIPHRLRNQDHTVKDHSIQVVSIPKCGTHLIWRCIDLIIAGKNKPIYKGNPHQKYCQEGFDELVGRKAITFFIFRDPRDMIVSAYFWVNKHMARASNALVRGTNPAYFAYKNVPINEFILDLINDGKNFFDGYGGQKFYEKIAAEYTTQGIARFYAEYLAWIEADNVCTVQFENLVGSKGGGSDELQYHEIKRIAEHIGIALSDDQIKNVMANLFGSSYTFREGKIGSWKKYFTPELKQACKEKAGDLLIDLGYEKDNGW